MNSPIRIKNEEYFKLVQQRLDAAEQVRIPVKGRSMEPFLYEKDEVLLQPAIQAKIAIGDIILVHWNEGYILHRVVRIKKGWLWLAGDNNLVQLEKVAEADVLAVLIAAERKGKPLKVARPFYKMLGMAWYYTRFPRRIWTAIKRRL